MALLQENKVVQLTPENVKALQMALQLNIEAQETCPICLDTLSSPVITACAHAFDLNCIQQVIERQHKCPMCRAPIENDSSLVHPAADLGETTDGAEEDVDPDASSSKIEALLKILTAQGQATGTKTIVFSQWTSFLNLLEPHLIRNDIRFARIDGTKNTASRDASMQLLTHDPKCKVMLASLAVCSVGLNLVAANQVILADSWWAPAIEDQAVDRVHRLGQKRETTVWKLVMENSIEDHVLEIQKRKRELMSTAFREKMANKEDRRTTMRDIARLLR
jgi:SWI/SNF-related matrix-associated actin-dependent regulator of chromatin subfamily A3